VAWREAFLRLARTEAALTPNLVPAYLGELATLGRLVELVEALMQEKTLLRHDGRAIEEALFAWADQHGQRPILLGQRWHQPDCTRGGGLGGWSLVCR
jgi:hypothetical protein